MAERTAPLRLLAEDADDLAVISAALQDAVAKVGDIHYEPEARRLTIAFNRYPLGGAAATRAGALGPAARRRCWRSRRASCGATPRDAVVELLAVTFEPGEAPGRRGHAQLRRRRRPAREVECVDAVLADVSEPWPTPRAPAHERIGRAGMALESRAAAKEAAPCAASTSPTPTSRPPSRPSWTSAARPPADVDAAVREVHRARCGPRAWRPCCASPSDFDRRRAGRGSPSGSRRRRSRPAPRPARPRCARPSPSPPSASAAYHARQRPADLRFTDEAGVELGWRWTPLEAVGIYVPGGRAAYPSTVLMNAVPAAVAGVERIAMVTPPGRLEPAVLAAAKAAGRHRDLAGRRRPGGARRWPMAPGRSGRSTRSSGPATPIVTAAKRRLYGVVGIDALAGPSEIVVVADAANDPDWIAADLLSQAEHDPAAQSILITDDAAFADAGRGRRRATSSRRWPPARTPPPPGATTARW